MGGFGTPTGGSAGTSAAAARSDHTHGTTINAQTGTSYTLVLTDAGCWVTMNNASASTLTVPPNSSVAFPVGTQIEGAQLGAGQVTLTAGGGVTINATPGLKIAAQYGVYGLKKIATDTWVGPMADWQASGNFTKCRRSVRVMAATGPPWLGACALGITCAGAARTALLARGRDARRSPCPLVGYVLRTNGSDDMASSCVRCAATGFRVVSRTATTCPYTRATAESTTTECATTAIRTPCAVLRREKASSTRAGTGSTPYLVLSSMSTATSWSRCSDDRCFRLSRFTTRTECAPTTARRTLSYGPAPSLPGSESRTRSRGLSNYSPSTRRSASRSSAYGRLSA